MKNSRVLKTVLFFSGLVAAGIGGTILLIPTVFYASYGIDLGGDISMLNEIRTAGGALLTVGILIILGAFVVSLTFTSVVVAALTYLSYGTSRILSFGIDGMPAEGLVQAAAFEIVIGMLCLTTFAKYRIKREES